MTKRKTVDSPKTATTTAGTGKAVTKAKASTAQLSPLNTLDIDERYIKAGEQEKWTAEFASGALTEEAITRKLSARALAQPEVRAATVVQTWDPRLDINATGDELREQMAAVAKGSMARPEAILVAQAHTLDALFSVLAVRSHSNAAAGYMDASERYLRLALKAQSQCRSTIEALAEIKNPRPVAFVKQANISHGHQQVNNGIQAGTAHAHGNLSLQSNKLSGGTYELLPNTGASALAGRVDTPLETVGEIHRATDGGRQGHQRSQQSEARKPLKEHLKSVARVKGLPPTVR